MQKYNWKKFSINTSLMFIFYLIEQLPINLVCEVMSVRYIISYWQIILTDMYGISSTGSANIIILRIRVRGEVPNPICPCLAPGHINIRKSCPLNIIAIFVIKSAIATEVLIFGMWGLENFQTDFDHSSGKGATPKRALFVRSFIPIPSLLLHLYLVKW